MPRPCLPLVLGLLVLGGVQAQGSHPAAMPGMSSPAMDGTDLSALSGRAFDRAFLSRMIAHHQGAVDMSRTALSHARDPQVRQWAQAIVRAQQGEITEMRRWLAGLGGVDRAAQANMANDMTGMVAAVKRAGTDRAFVSGMLPHHASAISMASVALQRSRDPRVLRLARAIIQDQANEMYAFRQWLIKHPG